MRRLAADAVVINNSKLLLVRRAIPPFKGMLALPGGHIEENETLERCIEREVYEETGLTVHPYMLIGVYSDPARDPRKTVSAAYLCRLERGTAHAGSDSSEVVWMPLNEIKSADFAFDHEKIIMNALKLVEAES